MSSKPTTTRSSTRTGGDAAQNSAPTRSSARLRERASRSQYSTRSFTSGEGALPAPSQGNNDPVPVLTPPPPPPAVEDVPAPPSTPKQSLRETMDNVASILPVKETPRSCTTQSGAHLIDVKAQQRAISRELEHHIVQANESFAKGLYKETFTDEAIDAYLRYSKKYRYEEKKWGTIPIGTDEKGLYKPFVELFQEILTFFKLRSTSTGNRKAWISESGWFKHKEDEATSHHTAPDFSIMGSGPAFPPPEKGDVPPSPDPCYQYTVASFDAKLDANINKVASEQIPQLGVYARQVYSFQPNRQFVRSLIVSECNVRILHYDRSGVQYSPTINIGEEAVTFVRLVLGLSSVDERLVGFDVSISWRKTDDGIWKGYIKSVDKDKKPVEYEVIGKEPQFTRRSIRGRGTTCWLVRAPDAVRLIVKDSWRSEGRVPEWEFLEAAKGLDGVAQMIAYEEGASTRDFRGASTGDYADFRNRIFCRIIMKVYGGSIDRFENVLQVLCAFRDAIAGHRRLLHRCILHRDISVNNILIGEPNARVGNRGVLIDLDMAIFMKRSESLGTADFRTGTRMFQSIMVLSSTEFQGKAPRHDYLDDLEGFFYVFCYLVLGYHAPGKKCKPLPVRMEKWDSEDPETALAQKCKFMLSPLVLDVVEGISDFWGPTCRQLFEGLHETFQTIVSQKLRIVTATKERDVTKLHQQVEEQYDSILALFDRAIKELESNAKPDEPSPPPPCPSTPPRPTQNYRVLRAVPSFPPDGSQSFNGKRASGDYPDDSPSAKRPKHSHSLNPSSLQHSLDVDIENTGA